MGLKRGSCHGLATHPALKQNKQSQLGKAINKIQSTWFLSFPSSFLSIVYSASLTQSLGHFILGMHEH
jgi:hypothetical protein